MNLDPQFLPRVEELKRYIDWSPQDDACSEELLRLLRPHFAIVVNDFYDEILRHPGAARVITGGQRQIERLRQSLMLWLEETLQGKHDPGYIESRWTIGQRHVDIGLDQLYVNAAFARIRGLLGDAICRHDELTLERRLQLHASLNKRLDFDLAIMSDAYQTEYQFRQIPVDHSRLKQQSCLAQLSRNALAGAPLDILFDQSVAYLMETLQGDFGEFLEFAPSEDVFLLRSAAGWSEELLNETVGRRHSDAYLDWICDSLEAVRIDDHDLRPGFPTPAWFGGQRIVSSLHVAVRNEDEIYGILGVHFQKRRQLQPSDHDFLVSIANLIANAVHRKGIEHQRAQSEYQLRRLIERLPAGAVYVTGGKLQVNHAVEIMTGRSREELATLEDWERLLVDAVLEETTRRTVQPIDQRVFQWEVHLRRADGQVRLISQLKLQSATDEIWLLHDITGVEEQRRRQLQAERLAAIGQMIAGLAHESRNALQRIQACSEMLELEFESPSEEMQLIKRLQQAQSDLQHLFNEVRDYAAPIVLDLEDIDLAQVSRKAWEQLEPLRRKHSSHLELEHPSSAAMRGDEFRLVQVFRNLFENSVAACPGEVEVHVLMERKETELRVIITDNGPGFHEEVAQRMLEPFFTTKTKGSGLGMAIASRIVDAHGGHIQPISRPGMGAKFVLSFPLEQAAVSTEG